MACFDTRGVFVEGVEVELEVELEVVAVVLAELVVVVVPAVILIEWVLVGLWIVARPVCSSSSKRNEQCSPS